MTASGRVRPASANTDSRVASTSTTNHTAPVAPNPTELAHIREIVSTTRAAQGLPPVTTDDLTLGRVAELLRVAAPRLKATSIRKAAA